MICDTHVHLAPLGLTKVLPPKNIPAYREVREMSADSYLKAADMCGVRYAVVFPHIFPEISATEGTKYIIKTAAEHPNRFVPFLRIDEKIEIINEFSAQIKGIKEQFLLTKHVDIKNFFPTYELMQDKGLVLISHPSTNCRISRIAQISDNFPKLKIILAHSGRAFNAPRDIIATEVGRELYKYPNVFFDTSTVLEPEAIGKLVSTVGGERILFGSDLPFGEEKTLLDSYRAEIKAITDIRLPSSEKDKILSKNFIELFSLPKSISHHNVKTPRAPIQHDRT